MSGPSYPKPTGAESPGDRSAILQAIDDLASAIGDARIRVESGERVDLTGLDDRVRAICASIGRQEGSAARSLLPELSCLTEALDILESVLKRQNRQVLPMSRPAEPPRTPPQRAAGAYAARSPRPVDPR
jgi:hypothetical protein